MRWIAPTWDCPHPCEMYVVTRPKLRGPGEHFGVIAGFGDGAFIAYELTRLGFRSGSVDAFLAGHRPEILDWTQDPREIAASWQRLEHVATQPVLAQYNPCQWNCEHAATFVASGWARSQQIEVLRDRILDGAAALAIGLAAAVAGGGLVLERA